MQERLALFALALGDLIALLLSYNVVYWRRLGDWPVVSSGLSVFVFVWLGSSYLFGRYSARPAQRNLSFQLLRLAIVVLLILGIFVFHAWLFHIQDAATRFRGFLIPLLVMTSGMSLLIQLLAYLQPRSHFDWLMVGTDQECSALRTEFISDHTMLKFLPHLHSQAEFESILFSGMLPTRFAIGSAFALSENVRLHDFAVEKLLALRAQGVQIFTLVDWCEIALQRVPPELIDQRWFLAAEGFNIQPGRIGWRLKRLVDLIGAFILIVLTSPLMLLAILLIWFEDGGPVFYSQIRTGLYGERVKIWKFRSMRVDAESGGIQWASQDDPRITRCGALLRQLRIDELPQLFAVLSGELSLIGPRPERPELEVELETVIPHYRIRHWIRPGLSGWAQVNYPYGSSVEDSKAKLSFDLFYLRNAGFWLDALIVLKTIRLLAGAKGAQPRQ
mgnify:CR=1 FL=1|tara:strand:- start:3577 stop:4914 length:1338 start_codon:yes stop_codon:yes gene_type:complete